MNTLGEKSFTQIMNDNTNTKPFDPTTGPALKIVPCQNGWSLIQSTSQYDGPNSCCIVYPSHVFNSPAELANAVANLVQFGSIEKPPEEIVDVEQRFLKLLAERSCGFFDSSLR